jgi:hypothetical protein
MREFKTGATRDADEGKVDLTGAMSPLAVIVFLEYMRKHQVQADGKLRSSDNWKKGMPKEQYMKSLGRHFLEAWKLVELGVPDERQIEEALCGVIFNAFGWIHEARCRK